jgi:hypothetical protein
MMQGSCKLKRAQDDNENNEDNAMEMAIISLQIANWPRLRRYHASGFAKASCETCVTGPSEIFGYAPRASKSQAW